MKAGGLATVIWWVGLAMVVLSAIANFLQWALSLVMSLITIAAIVMGIVAFIQFLASKANKPDQ